MTRFELRGLPEYTKDALVDELRRVAARVDGPLTKTAFQELSTVGLSTIRRHLGAWKSALAEAGLADRYSGQPVSAKMSRGGARDISDEEVLRELREFAAALGRSSLTVAELRQHERISPDVVRARFGSWRAGLERAGLQPGPMARRYSDDECMANLLRVWTHWGRQPAFQEMNQPPSAVGAKAYIVRWGGWRPALRAFIDHVNGGTPIATAHAPVVRTRREIRATEDQRAVPLGLRWKVLTRDRFRCVSCGGSPATRLDCELHVDHVVPFSKGGRTVVENLRTLCGGCNLGKGDR